MAMGVDFPQTRFLDHCARKGAMKGPMLALGSLTIQETEETILKYAKDWNYSQLAAEKSGAAFFRERYGVQDYASCDVNGQADEYIDLGQPLPHKYKNRYMTVFNGGTLEHVFDLRQAMENIHDALAVGGVIIHTTPTTWINHGFVNHNPIMHHLTAQANNYETIAEGTYYNVGTFPGQTRPVVSVYEIDDEIPGFGKRDKDMFSGPTLPAWSMHLIAHRKTSDAKFVVPQQVQY
jgi:SAM-dependent methyltransferase